MASIYVDRRTGGFGDLMMISAGLQKLTDEGHDVTLRLDEKWHPLFEGWDSNLTLVSKVPDAKFDQTSNLFAPCPASYVETRWVQNTRTSLGRAFVPETRVAIFWRSMGLLPEECTEKPVIKLRPDDLPEVKSFIGEKDPTKRLIYIQADCNETYRAWPFFDKLVERLAKTYNIIVTCPLNREIPGVKVLTGKHILVSCMIMARCDLVVSCDSMAIHAAAAFDVPCVGIFGPIGFDSRARLYPYCSGIVMDLPCLPCWRNQQDLCAYAKTESSFCLKELPLDEVEAAIRERDWEVAVVQNKPRQKIVTISLADKAT